MPPDDVALVRRCLAGHADAVRSLVERFQSDVLGLCTRILMHRQDAEDVVQETFLRVFRSLNRWDSQRPLKPWILGIAVNRCRTWMANRARRPESADFLNELPDRSPADHSAELAREIQSALTQMRSEYRTVFAMFHEQGSSYEEIAEVFGRPVGTIKTWLHRARMEVLTYLRLRGMVPDDISTTV